MASPKQSGLLLQLLALGLIATIGFLQYLLWIDEDGFRQTQALRIGIQAQIDKNAELAERNRALAAEIADLKNGLMAIEERARSDMGMIRNDETLYRLLEKPAPPTTAGRPSAATPSAKPSQPVPKPATANRAAARKPSAQAKPAPKPATANRAAVRKPSADPARPTPKPAATSRAAARKPSDQARPAPRAVTDKRRD